MVLLTDVHTRYMWWAVIHIGERLCSLRSANYATAETTDDNINTAKEKLSLHVG